MTLSDSPDTAINSDISQSFHLFLRSSATACCETPAMTWSLLSIHAHRFSFFHRRKDEVLTIGVD